jgi:predicted nucleic acid-binding protein
MFGDLSASRVMIDANVLIFAMRESRAGDGKETRDRTAAARQFIRAQEVVRISSIALAEVLRKLTDKEREFLNDPKHGLTNLYAEAFTDKMARVEHAIDVEEDDGADERAASVIH